MVNRGYTLNTILVQRRAKWGYEITTTIEAYTCLIVGLRRDAARTLCSSMLFHPKSRFFRERRYKRSALAVVALPLRLDRLLSGLGLVRTAPT